ncbi:MAG TPA: ScyD/ScyE family protein, partial [Blastocatellia bacterium]|nr:ScyD/ScyE family protein [Blastocatellia bacterium]
MNKNTLLLISLAALLLMPLSMNVSAQTATTTVFASGLRSPSKIIITPGGNLLVAEAGNGPNTGRISIVGPDGSVRTLIDGLPSGFAPPNNEPSGPSGLALRGRILYVTIGAGDATLNGPVPGTEMPNPDPSSPFLSSVLSIRLSPQVEQTTQGFTLTFADQLTLQTRGFLKLEDAAGNDLRLEVIANFRNFTYEPRPNFTGNVRASNPFGVAVRGNTLCVVDASQNSVVEVGANTGEIRTLLRFPPKPNPLPFGPPFIDAVPDSVTLVGKSLLVTFLTGFPFPPGAAEVRRVRLANNASEPFIGGLTAAIDVLAVEGPNRQNHFFTLEFSTNMLMGAPGRLSRFDQAGGPAVVLANNLMSP